jgi:hypothetical protein
MPFELLVRFAESQKSRVNCVGLLISHLITLLQESLRVVVILANGSCIPREVGPLFLMQEYLLYKLEKYNTDGSAWKSSGPFSASQPAISRETPNGRTPLQKLIRQYLHLR